MSIEKLFLKKLNKKIKADKQLQVKIKEIKHHFKKDKWELRYSLLREEFPMLDMLLLETLLFVKLKLKVKYSSKYAGLMISKS